MHAKLCQQGGVWAHGGVWQNGLCLCLSQSVTHNTSGTEISTKDMRAKVSVCVPLKSVIKEGFLEPKLNSAAWHVQNIIYKTHRHSKRPNSFCKMPRFLTQHPMPHKILAQLMNKLRKRLLFSAQIFFILRTNQKKKSKQVRFKPLWFQDFRPAVQRTSV
jgi:hypothetical protein